MLEVRMQCAYRLRKAGWYRPSSLRVRGLGFPRPGKVSGEKSRCDGLSMYLHTDTLLDSDSGW